ncbi:MAG: carboxypeptidase-like regulatory domain-containing protein, partial [Acidobacteria bacterium]|nr:carboxypeptidase-like regulatory domain-containing protein [Acidobacteriota bacterium]
YAATHLLPGKYQVTAEQKGFKRFVRTSVVLETAGVVRVDVALEVGDTATEVTVTAAVAAIETDTGRIGTIQSQALYQFAPVASNRGVFNHLVLSPGTVVNAQSTYSINGSRGYSSGFQIDGTNTGTPTNGAQESSQTPERDYLQESRIDSVSNNAEFAHAGNFAMTTKSGTNDVHGSAEYTIDASAMAARTYFAVVKPVYRGHYYHFYLSGPVALPGLYDGHNRTFFMVGYDGQTLPNEALVTPSVPSLAMRGGDFSRLFAANGTLTVIKDPLTGLPFANNTIPSNRIAGTAQKFQQMFYPLPNYGSADSISANYRGTVSTNDTVANNMVARFDHQFTLSNRSFVRFYRNVGNFKRNDGQLPAMGRFRRVRFNHSWTVADTHIFSPTLINEFRLGAYSKRWPINSGYLGKSVIDAVGLTGYPGAIDPNVNGTPVVNITGFNSIAASTTSLERLFNMDLNDSITWIRGGHTLKFGFNGMHSRQNSYPTSPSGSLGTFDFTGFATNYAMADFLLGIPRDSIRSGIVPAQDDWKVLSRLTLNFGLRYEYHQPFRDRDNRLANFDPVSGSIVVPTDAVKAYIAPNYPTNINVITAAQASFPAGRLMAGDKGDFAPRFGFAYRLDNNSTTVIRGGFGIYYDAQPRKTFSGLTSGPFVATQTFDNTITNNVPLYTWPQAFPVASSRALGVQSVTAANPNLQDSYAEQWNFTLERALPLQTGLRVSYIGFEAHQLPFRRNLNQPAPSTTTFVATRRPYQAFNAITYTDSGA